MVKVVYVADDGTRNEVDAQPGISLMQTAITQGIDGIVGECGGSAMCATCHVYVDPDWIDRLPPRSDVEEEMLECTVSARKDNSRLSCQITAGPEIDGIVVHMPPEQI
ncbi:2Fe-2S iron-sulfur cluster-binding protein [Marinibaculum pumilum]|uniref:2Fe-2S iron-sulfur cluster-binding protein n=1 Tax=Marinibaculum pumilum TaxID=1766165 RepID=A0ABV7KTV8_9PROT